MRVRTSILIIMVWLFSGCATKVVSIYNSRAGVKSPRTFLVRTARERTVLSEENQQLDSLLQSIITNNLKHKGLKVSAIPDLYVSYLINTHSATEVSDTYNNAYYGYNYYTYPTYYDFNARTYKEGVFIIDIKNNNDVLIWQGSKTFKVRSKLSIQDLLPDICREVIDTYKINP
jgi:uncharacterized protein DUF4136